tara:strand:- start:9510 stop:10685 length:1176 start_codon:yes stop_codon:yes gene_type:complete
MIFQILDDKRDCLGLFSNGEFYYGHIKRSFEKTWDWSPHLSDDDYEYARIWCGGKSLEEACPEHLVDRLEIHKKKVKNFVKAASIAKINISDICLFDIIPEQALLHWCQVKNEICEYVFENYTKPANHKFMIDLSKLVHDISNNPVVLNQDLLFNYQKTDYKAKSLWKSFGGKTSHISYDIYGSVTGRLTTKTNSFPILNLKKDIADIVLPKNDAFIQFDFNGAEVRTLLSLSGQPQPKEDIHEFNAKILKCSRDQAKKKFFAWFYNPNKKNQELESIYKRKDVLVKHRIDNTIKTPFGRKIKTDDFHALNYLLQSASSDNCLAQAIKINKFLNGRKSFVHSVVHDSMTIDLDKHDRDLITQIRQIFEDTRLGHFKSSMHIGRNYKDMEEV